MARSAKVTKKNRDSPSSFSDIVRLAIPNKGRIAAPITDLVEKSGLHLAENGAERRLITPNRPMSMEATSGKNPINHIGKIYNLLSTQIAHDCVKKVDGVEEMYIRLLSQIGQPIDQPLVASVQVLPVSGVKLKDINAEIMGIVDDKLANVTQITEKVIEGKLKTF